MLLDKIITPWIRTALSYGKKTWCVMCSLHYLVLLWFFRVQGLEMNPKKIVHLVTVGLSQLFWCTTYSSAFVYLQCWRWCLSPWIIAICIHSSFPWHYVCRSWVASCILPYSVKHCGSFHCTGAALDKKLACSGETADQIRQIHDFKLIWWGIWKKSEEHYIQFGSYIWNNL